MTTLHDQDFYSWTIEQAALLRSRNFDALDFDNLLEEIEDMGKSEQRELYSRLKVLLLHLLKWQYQPLKQSSSWRNTIKVQRVDLARHLRKNPGLKPLMSEELIDAYVVARLMAEGETGMDQSNFPETCPWSVDQVIAADFFP